MTAASSMSAISRRRPPQRGEELPPRVFLEKQVTHVDLSNLIADQVEIRVEAPIQQVRLI